MLWVFTVVFLSLYFFCLSLASLSLSLPYKMSGLVEEGPVLMSGSLVLYSQWFNSSAGAAPVDGCGVALCTHRCLFISMTRSFFSNVAL